MAGFGFFKNNTAAPRTAEETILARPYKLSICERDFIQTRTVVLFEKILKRCYHKTGGITEKEANNIALSVFLSVENGAQKNGTIPLVAQAMASRQKIYLVYDAKIALARKATAEEQQELSTQYADNNNALGTLKSGLRGMILDFTNYKLASLVRCYMGLIYAVMDSANTQVNLARSLQIKINKLRDNISVLTSDDAIKQASGINNALKEGRSVLLDNLDNVIQTAINADSIKQALTIFYSALASDLGLSVSFVSGELTSGMSATGDADINYEEDGIKDFWVSIWRPICIRLYNQTKVKFITDRWRNIGAKLQNLVYVENSDLYTLEQKQEFAQSILNGEI